MRRLHDDYHRGRVLMRLLETPHCGMGHLPADDGLAEHIAIERELAERAEREADYAYEAYREREEGWY